MSAIPTRIPLARADAETVLASLRARKEGLALALGRDAPGDVARAPADVYGAFLLPGAVVELSALPGAGGLTLALLLLAEAHRRAQAAGRPAYLCACDPSRTLHGPAVAALGVALDTLVVFQPDADRLLRTAVRAQRSGSFAAVLVDASQETDVGRIVTGVRRLILASEEHDAHAVLVTSARAKRGLPLPVAARALVDTALGADGAREIQVRFLRHRHGQLPRMALPLRALP